MLFSSLLPVPKHSKKPDSNADKTYKERNREATLQAILKESSKKNDKDDSTASTNILDSTMMDGVSFQDFVPLRQRNFNMEIPLPTQQQIDETFQRTKKAFDKIVMLNAKPASSIIQSSQKANENAYEVQHSSLTGDGAIKSRVFKIVQHAHDPLQPNTIKAKKVIAPVIEEGQTPIFHKTDTGVTTEKTLTKEERDQWNIPTAISSWKNPNGYTVELDTRLALDARFNKNNMQAYEINEKFSQLSSALENADKKARQRLKLKAEAKRQLAEEQLREKEENLKLLAQKARVERERSLKGRYKGSITENGDSSDAASARYAVNKIRKKEIEKDIRKSKMSTVDRLRELAYAQGRDISEKVVLGAAKATETAEVNYDSRLFSKGANAQAKRSEDQVYDNPLFVQQNINNIYRTNLTKLDNVIQEEDNIGDNSNNNSTAVNSEPIQFTEAEKSTDKKKDSEFGLQVEDKSSM